MNDLRNALRALESQAPDAEVVRAKVRERIDVRTRRKRTALAAGSALAVIGLAVGAVTVIGSSGSDQIPVASAPSISQETEPTRTQQPEQVGDKELVENTADPDVTVPMTLPDEFISETAAWERGRDGEWVSLWSAFATDGPRFQVFFSADELEVGMWGPVLSTGTITVHGETATLRVVDAEDGNQTQILWQESGEWVLVNADTQAQAKQVAEALAPEPWTVRPAADVRLVPEGYVVSYRTWPNSGVAEVSRFDVCDSGAERADCYYVAVSPPAGQVNPEDGPEPDLGKSCTSSSDEGTSFGAPQEVDGATVRLSSDGCAALATLADGTVVHVRGEPGVPLLPGQLGQMAVSVAVE